MSANTSPLKSNASATSRNTRDSSSFGASNLSRGATRAPSRPRPSARQTTEGPSRSWDVARRQNAESSSSSAQTQMTAAQPQRRPVRPVQACQSITPSPPLRRPSPATKDVNAHRLAGQVGSRMRSLERWDCTVTSPPPLPRLQELRSPSAAHNHRIRRHRRTAARVRRRGAARRQAFTARSAKISCRRSTSSGSHDVQAALLPSWRGSFSALWR